jgi:hypothetical protein
MRAGATVTYSSLPAIALTDPQDMVGKIGAYGTSGAGEPKKVDSLQLDYRGPRTYVSIAVSTPAARAAAADVPPAELKRIGLGPESGRATRRTWRESPRAVVVDGVPVYGAEADRSGGWEFRGFVEDAGALLRLQVLAFGFERERVELRRADPLPFLLDSWRR